MTEEAQPAQPGPPGPQDPAEPAVPADVRPASEPPAPPRSRRRPPVFVMIAVVLSVPILVVTFTKERDPQGPVSMSTLREHYGWEGAVLSLFDTLRRDFPQDFAGSAVGTDERHSGWVGFRDAVPAGAATLLAFFASDPRNGSVEVLDHLGFTRAELDARLGSARAGLARLGATRDPAVRDAVVRADYRTGVLDVEASRAPGAPGPDADVRNAVLAALGDGSPVRFVPWTDGARPGPDTQPARVTLRGTASAGPSAASSAVPSAGPSGR